MRTIKTLSFDILTCSSCAKLLVSQSCKKYSSFSGINPPFCGPGVFKQLMEQNFEARIDLVEIPSGAQEEASIEVVKMIREIWRWQPEKQNLISGTKKETHKSCFPLGSVRWQSFQLCFQVACWLSQNSAMIDHAWHDPTFSKSWQLPQFSTISPAWR